MYNVHAMSTTEFIFMIVEIAIIFFGTIFIGWQVFQSRRNIGTNRTERTIEFLIKHRKEFNKVYDVIRKWKMEGYRGKKFPEFLQYYKSRQKYNVDETIKEEADVLFGHVILITSFYMGIPKIYDIEIIKNNKEYFTQYYKYIKSYLCYIREKGNDPDPEYNLELDELVNLIS